MKGDHVNEENRKLENKKKKNTRKKNPKKWKQKNNNINERILAGSSLCANKTSREKVYKS